MTPKARKVYRQLMRAIRRRWKLDDARCRYTDCKAQHPIAEAHERVTCDLCRRYLGLPALTAPATF